LAFLNALSQHRREKKHNEKTVWTKTTSALRRLKWLPHFQWKRKKLSSREHDRVTTRKANAFN
jgi:hypothetical protein